ncbi:MAG: PD40 domain-containing protein [Holophagales bacterium]|nr:PD40 domain-containing protein [Holophagales bacterium]
MIGSKLGPYSVTAKLGEGGMGEVYRATDTKLEREVAIKVLSAAFVEDPERLARFEREAKLLAQLHHPNIASVFGLEESAGVRALVMELVEGPTLAERLAQGGLSIDESLSIARQIAEALEAAHEKGIVHRDLKPQNVKASLEGNLKVLDFGLAKAMDPTSASGSAGDLARSPTLLNSPTLTAAGTQLGVILGTAAYMAPEQARGVGADKRVDIWAFGVVLFEMLAGRRLFEGELVTDVLANVLKQEVDFGALPVDTPPAVRRLLRRCLERNPKNRLHDIADARLVLDDALSGRGDEAAPAVQAPERAGSPWPTRLTWLAVGVALAAAALLPLRRAPAATATGDAGPRTFALRRLTELPGAELKPSISPEGRMIVYASAASGNLDLYLLRVGGDRAIRLTDDPADDNQAAFSPDGGRIAFRSEREGGGLFVMGATGESVRRVTDAGFDPTWSPDGKRLAYATEETVDPVSRDTKSELWIVEIDTGRKTRLLPGDAVQPTWSRQGDRIAYWANTDGQRDLWTVAAGGGEPVAVTQDVATDWSPEWSPDGRWLYFSSDRGGSFNLWRIPIDPATGGTAGVPQPVTTGVRGMAYARFAADGSRLAAMAYERTYEQTIYDVDPRDPAKLVPRRTLRNPSARWCSLSPDGSTLACNTADAPEDLLLLRSDGAEMRRLTSDLDKDREALFDPSGKRLAFYSTRSGRWEAWTIGADGSDLRQLSDIGGAFPVGWSPDGKRVLVTYGDVPHQRYFWLDPQRLETLESAEAIPELTREGGFYPTSRSHAGDRVAGGIDNASGRALEIAIWTPATQSIRRLGVPVSGRTFGAVAGWTVDDRALIVRSTEGVVAVDLESGKRRVLAPAGERSHLSLSRDGRTLSIENEILDSDVWLLEFQ